MTALVSCRPIARLLRSQQRGAVGVVHRAAPLPAGLFAKHIGGAPGFIDPPLSARVAQPGLHDHQGVVGPLDHLHGPLGHLKLAVKVIGDGSEGAADGGNAAHHHAGFDHQGGVFGVEGHQGLEVAPGDGGVTGLDQGAKGMRAHAVLLVSGGSGRATRPIPDINTGHKKSPAFVKKRGIVSVS